MQLIKHIKLFTDGGARGNPGNAACACFLFDENNKLINFDGKYLGIATNNTAEYEGLILGIYLALKYSPILIECYLDSELVVKQLNGLYKVKHPNTIKAKKEIDKLIVQIEKITFNYIPREQNPNTDRLVNIILDTIK